MLILIVGPSGAGKDTLLDAARRELGDEPAFRFARRVITRAPAPDGENNIFASPASFGALREAGGFFLHWEAHGLGYGIPADVAYDLRAGRAVVASVSRGVVAEARARTPAHVIEITAPPEILAARLAARGREGEADISARLTRKPLSDGLVRDAVIVNDSSIAEGAEKLVSAIRRAAERATRA